MRFLTVTCAAILSLLTCQCGSKKEDSAKTDSPSQQAATEAETTKVATPVFEGPGQYLAKTIGEWTLSGNPRYFGPDNLYDLINGGSEVYTAYGLKKMVTADFKSPAHKNATLTVEIYDLGSSLGAFGRFSRFLDGEADPSKSGEGLSDAVAPNGRFGGANATFYKGSYLVNLTILDESPSATMESIKAAGDKILPQFADVLYKKLPSGEALPNTLTAFPKENLIGKSQGYSPDKFMSIEGICPCYTARYKKDDKSWTLAISKPFEDNAAQDAAVAEIKKSAGMTVEKAGKRLTVLKASKGISDAQNQLKILAKTVTSL